MRRLPRAFLVCFLIAPSKNSDGVCGASSYVRNCSMSVLDFRTQVILLKIMSRVHNSVFLANADTILITNRFYFVTAMQSISVNDFPVNFAAALWPI